MWSAVDEIAKEDDAIARAGGDGVEELDGFVVATVQVADQNGSSMHDEPTDAAIVSHVTRLSITVALCATALASGCGKKAGADDPYAAPSTVALAPAPGEAPRSSVRLALSPTELKRDATLIGTVGELRESAHDEGVQSRLATALGTPADVIVFVDRATPFEVLSSLVGLLGAAGVRSDRVELAVAGADGRTAAVRLGPPSPATCELVLINVIKDAGVAKRPNANDLPCKPEPGLNPIVRIESEGFGVVAGGANLATNCDDIGPGLAVRGHDLPLLSACLDRIKHLHKEFETERSLMVVAPPATRFEDVAPVLVAVRKAAGGAELFPDVTLATR